MINIEYKETVDEELGELINTGFNEFADKNNVVCNYSPFCFIAKENNEVVGIITGHSYYKEVHIGDLIVLEQHRKKNIGRQLINAVENYHKGKGLRQITLTTYSFQAPEFYKKCGFVMEFVREDIEDQKLNKYFFIKWFH